MSQIFVSYASADRERAKTIAQGLTAEGWSVWWDRVIPPGKQFDEVIEEALDAARCVIVLWSHASVASNWVKTEAAEAMRRKILIPALIEDVKIPLEFRRLQAADLSAWDGARSDPAWRQFVASVEREVTRSHEPEPEPEPPRPPPKPTPPPVGPSDERRRSRMPAIVAAVAVVVTAVLGAGLYFERARNMELAERTSRESEAREREERERLAREETARLERERTARSDAARAERERLAREEAARADAQRRAEQTRRARTETQPGPEAGVPPSGVVNLQWRDYVLGYTGTLTWNPSSAILRAAIVDLRTGIRIGNYAVPAHVSQQGAAEYLVSAEFAIPADSTTPGPHTHVSRLLLRAQRDGSVRLVNNCPRPGECY